MILNKNFLKQIRIYKTFKFSLYRASSFELYKRVILVAFTLKTLKENIEFLTSDDISTIKELLKESVDGFYIRELEWNKNNFFLGEKEFFLDAEFIIDSDMQDIYDTFKRFDRVKFFDDFIEERKEFFERLTVLEEGLFFIMISIPKEKVKKVKRFRNFLEKI